MPDEKSALMVQWANALTAAPFIRWVNLPFQAFAGAKHVQDPTGVVHSAHSDVQPSEPKARIFISYSRKDMFFVDRLESALKAREFEPLIDRTEICAFEDWWKRIEVLIGRADTIVFVLSLDAVASEVTLKEVAYAASLNKRFAPIVCRRVKDSAVPEPLRRLNFIFFDDPARFEANADALAEALETDIGWVRQHTEYGEAARRWSAAGRSGGLLLRSPALEVAEHWIMSRPRRGPQPTNEIQAFVAESRQGARAAQRRRRLLEALIYTLLIGIIAGLVGWINQAYVKERWNWYTTMRPYRVTNFDPHVLKPEREWALKPKDVFQECAKDCPEMIVVPAGEFMMGSPATEKDREDSEGPQHKVVIATPFAVSKFEVTFADWDACVSVGGCPQASDSGFGRGSRPVINVTWDDAQQYVAWFSEMTGQRYRLLSEAEWEYATRAGTTTAYWWGNEIGTGNANCVGCGSKWDKQQTSPVGSFQPNRFGLYDMAGNVWQWLQDCYHDNYTDAPKDGSVWRIGTCNYRVVRAGSWIDKLVYLRSAGRSWFGPDNRVNNLGFRVARTLGRRVDVALVVDVSSARRAQQPGIKRTDL
jgi:formylglycine-generating enzyme required for sulfatase activity